MNTFETNGTVGPNGVLNLQNLPFPDGQAVRVRVEQQSGDSQGPRILGLHQGMIWMSDDFDDPLPESFWLGKDADDENPT